MPLYKYKCPTCGLQARRILLARQKDEPQTCVCGERLERDPSPPSSHVREVVDNGMMPRAVDRFSKAEELYKNRAKELEQKMKE